MVKVRFPHNLCISGFFGNDGQYLDLALALPNPDCNPWSFNIWFIHLSSPGVCVLQDSEAMI